MKSWPKLMVIVNREVKAVVPLEPPCTTTRPASAQQACPKRGAGSAPTAPRRCQRNVEVFSTCRSLKYLPCMRGVLFSHAAGRLQGPRQSRWTAVPPDLGVAAAKDEHEVRGDHARAVAVALRRRMPRAGRARPVAGGQRQHVHVAEHSRVAEAAEHDERIAVIPHRAVPLPPGRSLLRAALGTMRGYAGLGADRILPTHTRTRAHPGGVHGRPGKGIRVAAVHVPAGPFAARTAEEVDAVLSHRRQAVARQAWWVVLRLLGALPCPPICSR